MKKIDLDRFFKSLGLSARRKILAFLDRKGEQTVGAVVAEFNLSQPVVSDHLAMLHGVSLVDRRRDGHNVLYQLTSLGRDTLNFIHRTEISLAQLP